MVGLCTSRVLPTLKLDIHHSEAGDTHVSNKELQALKERYVAAGAASPNEQFADHALNAELWDADGKRMIDFAGALAFSTSATAIRKWWRPSKHSSIN